MDLRRHLQGEPILAIPTGVVTKGIKWARRHRTLGAVAGALLAGGAAIWIVLMANTAAFRGRIEDLIVKARAAEQGGRFVEARDLYGEVKALLSGHPEAVPKFYEMETAAKAEDRRRAAGKFLQEGRKAVHDHERFTPTVRHA